MPVAMRLACPLLKQAVLIEGAGDRRRTVRQSRLLVSCSLCFLDFPKECLEEAWGLRTGQHKLEVILVRRVNLVAVVAGWFLLWVFLDEA